MNGLKSRDGIWRYLRDSAILVVAYYVTAMIGLRWAAVPGALTPIFPAAGVALAGLLLGGMRLWPAIVVARMLTFAAVGSDAPLWMQIAVSFSTMTSGLLGAYVLQRWVQIDLGIGRLRDVLWILGAGAIAAPVLGATLGTICTTIAFNRTWAQAELGWFNWWISNVTGVLVLVPLILSWTRGGPTRPTGAWWLHLFGSVAATAGATWLVFGPQDTAISRGFFVFPYLVWAALACGVRGAATASLAIAVAGIWGVETGVGTLVHPGQAQGSPAQILLLQQFLAVATATGLVLAVVADERRAQEQIRASEERLRLAVNAANAIAFDWDVESDVVARVTPAGPSHLGEEEANETGTAEQYFQGVHDDDRPGLIAAQRNLRPESPTYTLEYRYLTGDGRVRWIEDTARGEFDRAGKLVRVRGVAIDITDRMQSEEALRESEERFRLLVQVTTDVTWTSDATGAVVTPQPAWAAYTGQPWTEHQGFGWTEAIHPDDRARIVEEWTSTVGSGSPFHSRGRLWNAATGEYRHFTVTATPLLGSDGQVRGWVSAISDIEEQQRAEEALRRANAELEQRVAQRTADLVAKVEELEGFCYSVSHDMRAPLRAIVGRARMVLEEEGPRISSEGQEHLVRLDRAASQMAQLVDDLLQYARLGTRELRFEPVNLGDLVRHVANEVRRDRDDCGLEITVEEEAVVEGDPRLLGMALQNLIDNACKYRKPGRTAHVSFGRRGDAFYLRDDGIGFDMAYVRKLFVPFERLHREEYAGTGIGLANVRRVIERHGGRVWAEGEVGQGATFFFTLPEAVLAEADASDAEREAPVA